uniref:Bm3955, isoform b; Metallophos domain-containing protein n=1 Tax=Brugia malayi TaxID=6279 RepID=A0A7I4KHY7_BRUMA
MRKILLILLAVFLLSQTIFFVLKCFLTDVPYTVVTRLSIIVFQQFVMIFGSIFIWWNLSAATDDDLPLQPSYRCWRTICVQKVVKAAIILFLFLVHISSTFYYLWIGEEPNIFAMISLTSVAVYIYLIFFLLTFVLVQSVFRLIFHMNSKHFRFLRLLVANELSNRIFAVLLAVVFVLAGLWVTLLPPAVRRITIKIDNLPEVQKGFTVALLSDLHIGPTVGCSKIQKMVNTINLFKPGNHEYLHGNVDEWFVFLKKIKIIPLHNKNKKILVGNSRICIAGSDDLFAEQSRFSGHVMDYKKALRGCNKNDTTIMLIHQPNAVRIILNDVETAKNIDLILSGHTHGGQMYVFVPLVYFWNAYFRGLYYNKATGTYVYVSAGVNYFGPPVKIFDGNEIIIIKLV